MIHVEPSYAPLFDGLNDFEAWYRLEASTWMERYNRETLRFERGGVSFYLKRHGALGWKAWWIGRLRLSGGGAPGAAEEWRAIMAARGLGIPTLEPVAYGVEEGKAAARRRSFIVTRDVGPALSLEAFGERQLAGSSRLRSAVIDAVAGIARRLHKAGWCHRDFYLCHFLWRLPKGLEAHDQEAVRAVLEEEIARARGADLVLIDLHRMYRPPALWRRRYIVKDIGSLWFSALGACLNAAERARFVAAYESDEGPLAGCSEKQRRRFWRDVERRMRWVARRRTHR